MKKILAMLLILCMVFALGAASAGEPAALSFATIGDAMASEGFTDIAGGNDQHFAVLVEQDGAYIRLVADVDDEARRLNAVILETEGADALEAAFDAYNEYIKTLPIAYEEEITAAPATQEELDALAGKTFRETEEAGYEFSSSETDDGDTVFFIVSNGLYEYALLLNETYGEYVEHDDNGSTGDLTVKSASFAGLSHNAADLSYRADGSYDAENDPWAEYNRIMDLIAEALSGENPEAAIQALAEAMPEQAETIWMLAGIASAAGGENQK